MDDYLSRADGAIVAATGHLTVAQIARELPGKWSVARILEHLTLTFTLNTSVLEKAIASGDTRARRPTLVQRLLRTLVLETGYLPPAVAPEIVTPTGRIAPEHSRAAIRDALAALDVALARAEERFGAGTPLLKHAFFAAMTVPQWRRFHWRHTLHHMRQVRRRVAAG